MSKTTKPKNDSRRKFLVSTTSVLGSVGIATASWPFLASMQIDAGAKSMGANVLIDVRKLEPGAQMTVSWRNKPVWILRRTQEMLDHLQNQALINHLRDPLSQVSEQQPEYAANNTRSINPEYFIVVGLCTHLGCNPTFQSDVGRTEFSTDWHGGYYCPCHGSLFDLAGRVYKNVPAPTNLVVPPYRFITTTEIEIGPYQDEIS